MTKHNSEYSRVFPQRWSIVRVVFQQGWSVIRVVFQQGCFITRPPRHKTKNPNEWSADGWKLNTKWLSHSKPFLPLFCLFVLVLAFVHLTTVQYSFMINARQSYHRKCRKYQPDPCVPACFKQLGLQLNWTTGTDRPRHTTYSLPHPWANQNGGQMHFGLGTCSLDATRNWLRKQHQGVDMYRGYWIMKNSTGMQKQQPIFKMNWCHLKPSPHNYPLKQ